MHWRVESAIDKAAIKRFFDEEFEFAKTKHSDGALPADPDIALRLRQTIHEAVAKEPCNHRTISLTAQHEHRKCIAHASPNVLLSLRVKNYLENRLRITVKYGCHYPMGRFDEAVTDLGIQFMSRGPQEASQRAVSCFLFPVAEKMETEELCWSRLFEQLFRFDKWNVCRG
jgi:hypothetical protein